MARRFASWVPFYEYGDSRFFGVDAAPEPVVAARRAGFMRLAGLFAARYRQTLEKTAELAARYDRTQRSVRMMLSLAFLDPALIDAACCGTLPRGHGVTRLMDLPPRFADQWRALGLRRPV